jgi:hypothetical protein
LESDVGSAVVYEDGTSFILVTIKTQLDSIRAGNKIWNVKLAVAVNGIAETGGRPRQRTHHRRELVFEGAFVSNYNQIIDGSLIAPKRLVDL